MANRYYGDFRSLDNSVDPKGQRYRVLIFTGYTGESPYEYEAITRPHQGGYDELIGYVPKNNHPITMTDNPFTVTYEGDVENIYKPYRCSTATVSFLQSNINLDFLNANGTSTLVALLRWKNEVSEVNGRMYNSLTGETLSKKLVQEERHSPIVWYNDYDPSRYDTFCYNVEWIGFSTPETFSMGYTHVKDAFTLNAQDAFSVLQYSKYSWMGQDSDLCKTFLEMLLDSVGRLGTYKTIYITDTLKLSNPTQTGNVIRYLAEQQRNNFDEDFKPSDKLTVISQILTYLNLTAIPYRDRLIITTPNALADGWSNYNVYTLPPSTYFMNFGGGEYTQGTNQYLAHSHTLTGESFAASDTTISTANVYNSVTVNCDEFEVGDLLPDIHDDSNLNEGFYGVIRPNDGNNWKCWETVWYSPTTPDMKTYVYKPIVYNADRWSDVQQTDLQHAWLYANNQNSSWILDDGGVVDVPYNGAFPNKFSPSRTIYFITPNTYHASRNAVDNKDDYSLTMFYAKSKSGLFNSEQWLQITGDWHFYCNELVYHYPFNVYNMDDSNVVPNNSYVWVKLKFGNKWLTSTNGSTYNWVDTESWCKLWLYYNSTDEKANQGSSYPFRWTKRGIDGIVVKLPIDGNAVIPATFEIWIDKPLGVGNYLPTSATLSNFHLNIISSDYVESRGRREDTTTNTEYKAEMNPSAVEEYDNIEINLSSASDKGLNYSETVKVQGNGYTSTPKVYNVATANYSIPEQHITTNISNQYSTPTVSLQATIHNTVTPYTVYQWSYPPNRKFVCDSLTINYEMETATATMVEVKEPQQQPATRSNRTRNYHRNDDLIFNAEIADPDRDELVTDYDPNFNRALSRSSVTGTWFLETLSEVEGLVTMQPQFDGENNTLLISVPNIAEGDIDVEVDPSNNLILTFPSIEVL